MSVWPSISPANSSPALSGSEGELISISVTVDARRLENLLESLAAPPFPINPQIYHDAAWNYVYADGCQVFEATTLVEFPAYASWLSEIRSALKLSGFDPGAVHVNGMLEEIHSDARVEPSPAGAAYRTRILRKHGRALSASSAC